MYVPWQLTAHSAIHTHHCGVATWVDIVGQTCTDTGVTVWREILVAQVGGHIAHACPTKLETYVSVPA